MSSFLIYTLVIAALHFQNVVVMLPVQAKRYQTSLLGPVFTEEKAAIEAMVKFENELPKPEYSEKLAKYLASFSAASFCESNADIKDWNCGSCKQIGTETDIIYSDIVSINDPFSKRAAHQFLVAVDELNKKIVFSFRGTVNMVGWLTDMQFARIEGEKFNCPDCHVHSGIYKAYFNNGISQKVEEKLDYIVNTLLVEKDISSYTTHCTGHSLGGALSNFCAVHISQLKIPNLKLGDTYSFAQPRVGDRQFRQFFKANAGDLFRIVHNRDKVPHMMGMGRINKYYHAGTAIFYTTDNFQEGVYNIVPDSDGYFYHPSAFPNFSCERDNNGKWITSSASSNCYMPHERTFSAHTEEYMGIKKMVSIICGYNTTNHGL